MADIQSVLAKFKDQMASEEAAKIAPAPMPEPVAAPAPVAAPVQAPAVEAPKSEPMSAETKQLFAQAILGLAPILAGAAVSGARGGAIGAEAGLTGLKKMESLQEAQRTRERESSKLAQEQSLKNIELALKLQGAKTDQEKLSLLAQEQERKGKESEIENKRKWRELGLKEREFNLSERKYLSELGTNKKQLEALPQVTQDFLKKSGDEIAKKTFIANEISQAVAQFDDPKISNDQKIKIGQGLLKVLNSTQGSDAVGAEESKRLGSLLEFQILNLTQPGKVFGRDLPAFRDQAASTVNRLVDSVENVKKLSQQALSSGAIPSLQRIPLQESKNQLSIPSVGQTAIAAPKPAKVIQNGIEYNLNPATGQYE